MWYTGLKVHLKCTFQFKSAEQIKWAAHARRVMQIRKFLLPLFTKFNLINARQGELCISLYVWLSGHEFSSLTLRYLGQKQSSSFFALSWKDSWFYCHEFWQQKAVRKCLWIQAAYCGIQVRSERVIWLHSTPWKRQGTEYCVALSLFCILMNWKAAERKYHKWWWNGTLSPPGVMWTSMSSVWNRRLNIAWYQFCVLFEHSVWIVHQLKRTLKLVRRCHSPV